MSPLVPAPVSVWQLPHFCVKSCWPLSRLSFGPRSQPVRPTRPSSRAMVAISQIARPLIRRRFLWPPCRVAHERGNPICRRLTRPPVPRRGISLRRTARATAERRRSGGSRGHVERGPGRRARAHAAGDRHQDDREGHRRRPGLRRRVAGASDHHRAGHPQRGGDGQGPGHREGRRSHERKRHLRGARWSLEQAAEEMVQRGIRHLVVVDRGELVGVLSMRDIVRCWTQVGATSSMTSSVVIERLRHSGRRLQAAAPGWAASASPPLQGGAAWQPLTPSARWHRQRDRSRVGVLRLRHAGDLVAVGAKPADQGDQRDAPPITE